ncbi:MAG: hypothetical protein ACOYLB_15560 [Phototrophicaceae bacterium]
MANSRIYDILASVFMVLALVALVSFIYIGVSTPPPATPVPILPTIAVMAQLPTSTEVVPVGPPTLPPTFTATAPPSETAVASPLPASITPTITDTPTLTLTPIASATFTPTVTPTVTNTPREPSATPTMTRSPFPFQPATTVNYVANTFNSQACAFQAIGGQVLDMNGQGVQGVIVHAFGANGFDVSTTSGFSSAYGLGGFEIPVDSKPNANAYFIELKSALGTVLSEQVQVQFPAKCEGNIGFITWQQTRPIN